LVPHKGNAAGFFGDHTVTVADRHTGKAFYKDAGKVLATGPGVSFHGRIKVVIALPEGQTPPGKD